MSVFLRPTLYLHIPVDTFLIFTFLMVIGFTPLREAPTGQRGYGPGVCEQTIV